VQDFGPQSVESLPVQLWNAEEYNRFRLKPGQWTDDASMGLCLADSLLVKEGAFDPLDLRLRFHQWWTKGYNNAFGFDEERGSKSSVGLGGNISESMSEFLQKRTPYTRAGDSNTSGNGSVMRNAAVALCYHANIAAAVDVARKQR
jgi:ADP-ribosyl-[dinitrogen reductase] hydrolase